ncbi:uncharacterized protein LOC116208237 isoform X2 [Punica granatum]|uniref:Uncharacterized protein LOC116208237 isoform X2 n=2 Tax=Punica granatum TaxID=22663 RepID=A0A6P8DW53_PUNGR|nr:uncharacterized protein LOC116208237 isoform X2 [Punica granatum]
MQSFTSPSPSPPPPPYPQLSKASFTLQPSKLLLAFRRSLSSPYPSSLDPTYPGKQRRRQLIVTQDGRKGHAADGRVDGRGKKDNVWSIDNELAEKEREREKSRHRGRRKGRRVVRGKRGMDGRVMVSGAMLMEVESVLQTQEPVIKPAWTTFASSVSGIWKGVGAIFSPITAEMEPLEIGNKNERLYDCYTMSCCKAVSDPSEGGLASQIHRKINWVTLNPYGEISQQNGTNNSGGYKNGGASLSKGRMKREGVGKSTLPKFDSFDFGVSDVMEEDVMGNEPGLVFFEDGSYSRGPVDIPVGETDDSKYYVTPTLKFEQCLVKGCHKRLRIVHTIEFNNGGADIQIMRVAVYEEEWVSPSNLQVQSNLEFNAEPFSQRKRTQPSDLIGSWKVFEVSTTPIYGEDETVTEEQANGTPYVYLCTETLKKRSLPENLVCFGEEEMVDMRDVTILWLPGGVTGYVDINKEGILCVGVGWYSEEGMNLVMERDYGLDGKLREVRWKTEVKRRWSNPM